MTLPSNLPAILRGAGLKVVVVPGWYKRGRPASTGGFAPVGVLCHHTATGRGTSDKDVVDLLVRGRSDLPGPLCHMGLGRDGTVYLIAAGRANHAGRAKASGSVAGGDGNALYIGVEAFNDGVGEAWSAQQYGAYVLLAAALCKHVTGNSAQSVRAHKETSTTGKVDPRFDMDDFRVRVATILATPAPRIDQEDDDMAFLDEPLNVHDPKGQAQAQSVTVRELLTACAIDLTDGREAAQAYLDRARKSPAKKEA